MSLENIDWNAPRTPCQTEGCNWPNFHVCLVGKEDLFPELIKNLPTARSTKYTRSIQHNLAVSESQKARWAAIHAKYEERDREIVELYAEGNISINKLAEKFNVGRFVIRRVLRQAEADGAVIIRPIGLNVRYERV
jgi:GTP-sensing pleiotropic transcriptional regulator CodY